MYDHFLRGLLCGPFFGLCLYQEMGAAAEQEEAGMERRLRNLKNSRRGKKGSITKRIKQLQELLGENTGKKRLKFLAETLGGVSEELQKVCEEISDLSDVYDI